MKRLTLLLLGVAGPAFGQHMDHGAHAMPGMDMAPAPPGPAPVAPANNPPPPAAPTGYAADALYPPGEMAAARGAMLAEHGGMQFHQLFFNIAEIGVHRGRDGYRWDSEGWFGGDVDRFVVKSEGEGRFGETLDHAEVQALWSHAIDPYWNLQAGARQDVGAGARPTYLTVGVEGLAPYWFQVEGALFLSDKGDLTGRAEAYYDQRITQRLVLQPRIEVNLAAQDVARTRTGAGLSDAELGLRLRYEVTREFAPYAGISWTRDFGGTARYSRAAGDAPHAANLVAGVRFWF